MLLKQTEMWNLASCDAPLCSLGGAKVKKSLFVLVFGVTSNNNKKSRRLNLLFDVIYAMHIHHTPSLSNYCHWKPPPITATSSTWQTSLDPDVSASGWQRHRTAPKKQEKNCDICVVLFRFKLSEWATESAVIPPSVFCGFDGANMSTQSLFSRLLKWIL